MVRRKGGEKGVWLERGGGMVRRKGEARGVWLGGRGERRGCGWEEGRRGSLSGVVCASLCCSAVCVW